MVREVVVRLLSLFNTEAAPVVTFTSFIDEDGMVGEIGRPKGASTINGYSRFGSRHAPLAIACGWQVTLSGRNDSVARPAGLLCC